MHTADQLYQDRLRRREILSQLSTGIMHGDLDPYGQKFEGITPIDTIRRQFETHKDNKEVTFKAAGRVMSKNDFGKLVFFHLRDSTETIQIWASKGDLWDGVSSCSINGTDYPMPWYIVQNLLPGDIVGVQGYLTATRTGEISLRINEITMLCKSLATPPDKFHGITDPEVFSRNRHLELIYREGAVKTLQKRSEMVWKIRQCLNKHGFTEVETPILQPIAGGAAARPFQTHHNAYNANLYLRIAPELYLKKLLVGGMEKIYEIGKNFRNEGVDRTHNPEFTMLELYEAYGDVESMAYITRQIAGALGLNNIANARTTTYGDLFQEYCNITLLEHVLAPEWQYDPNSPSLMQGDPRYVIQWHHDLDAELAHKSGLPLLTPLVDRLEAVFDKIIQPQLTEPTFVFGYPSVLCPLAKPRDDEQWQGWICDRWELFVNGMEIANAYTELNNPDVQQANFEKQLGLQPGQHDPRIDYDFLDALIVGMPPAGGLGIGIDRLAMLYAETDAIRDVITFPHQRPK
jgi:lysyl-tRNA synthetase class 2